MKLRIRTVLLGIAIPLILCIVATIAFFTGRIQSTAKDVESIYYDTLFQIDTLLINADRDLYQALYAEQDFYYNQGSIDDERKQKLVKDYNDNNDQVDERVTEANSIASKQADLYALTDADGVSFKQHYEGFASGFATWKKLYDPSTASGDFDASMSGFKGIRNHLDAMQEISEAWAESAQADVQKATQSTVITGSCIFGFISILLLALSIIMIRMVMRDMSRMDASIKKLSDGDFVSNVDSKLAVADFGAIALRLEEMRKKLQSAIHEVKTNASKVNSGAEVASGQISDSKKTTKDISAAVSDLATGASVLAEEVQSATGVTANIGSSIDAIYETSKGNQERGQVLYDNSVHVKGQLEELKKADEMTDAMALEVTNSVNETADVVSQISMAADAIINIASETNLLALNASIEAARAGEVGKGFAVVADNIKSLAEESNKSANEITDMLSRITALSDKNKELTSKIKDATNNENVALLEMQASFDEMLETLKATEEGNRQIADQLQNLTKDKNTILETIESLSSISEENAASTQQTSASLTSLDESMDSVVTQADDLKGVADDLITGMSFFTVE